MDQLDYLSKNKELWNSRTEHHLKSEFYDVKGFREGKCSLKEIELNLLGDINSKSILHLQCHFGQDSLSLARRGARVTGVDFSDTAISTAKQLAAESNIDARFVCCDVYSLKENLNEKFDILFTSYGTIGWLPDLTKWAGIISQFLKPGGTFVFAEFHPVVWMFDDDFEKVGYNYFNSGPIHETENGTYADRSAPLHHEYVGWNHSLGEVLSALFNAGLRVDHFEEYDYSPYNCFRNTKEIAPGKFQIKHLDNKIPMVYSIRATKV